MDEVTLYDTNSLMPASLARFSGSPIAIVSAVVRGCQRGPYCACQQETNGARVHGAVRVARFCSVTPHGVYPPARIRR